MRLAMIVLRNRSIRIINAGKTEKVDRKRGRRPCPPVFVGERR